MRHVPFTQAPEQHGYHSAVEIDEEVGSWKDWAGPAIAVFFFFFLSAIIGVALVSSGIL